MCLLQLLIDVTRKQGCNFHDRGTVIVIEGPRFSTKAESFMFRSFGATLVGMTGVPEVILIPLLHIHTPGQLVVH